MLIGYKSLNFYLFYYFKNIQKTNLSDVLFQDAVHGNTMKENWNILLKILPILFDILEHCATNFRQNTVQTAPPLNEDYDQELSNIMRYTLQIFCLIFQRFIFYINK